MALSAALPKVSAGAGPQMRDSVQEAFDLIEVRVPRFDPVADEGKTLTIEDGVPTWVTPA